MQTSFSTRSAFASVVLAMSFAASGNAQDDDPTTTSLPMVVPYSGLLEQDGVGVTADVDMLFELSYGDLTWSEDWSDDLAVSVANGEFTVMLGALTSIPPVFFAAEEVELVVSLSVTECDDMGCLTFFEALAPTQTIVPVPHALWTTRGRDFTVANSLAADTLIAETPISVSGDIQAPNISGASINATTVAASSTLTGDADLIGDVITSRVQLRVNGDEIYYDAGASNWMVFQHDSANDILNLVGDSFSSGLGLNGHQVFMGNVVLDTVDSSDILFDPATVRGVTQSDPLAPVEEVHWSISSARPLMLLKYVTLTGGTASVNTGLSSTQYMCWVGGVEFTDGDVCELFNDACLTCEFDTDNDGWWNSSPWWNVPIRQCNRGSSSSNEYGIYQAYATPDSGTDTWWVRADFLTHYNDDDAEVLIICVQESVSRIVCPDGDIDVATGNVGPGWDGWDGTGDYLDNLYETNSSCTNTPWGPAWVETPRGWPPGP